jgi:mono/diheme cytochrome c family protein
MVFFEVMRRLAAIVIPLLVMSLGCATRPPADPEVVRLGRQVYGEEGCAACHGFDLRGAQMAPSLENLSRHWDAASLEHFLRAPNEVKASSSRLRKLDERYAAKMPGVFNHDSERLRALVTFLLDQ